MTNCAPEPHTATVTPNAIFCADALAFIECVPSETVTLAYFDPPLGLSGCDHFTSEGAATMRSHLKFLSRVLQQIRRTLKPNGNVFVHSEPVINGSIRLLLDQIFLRQHFRNEIIVPRPNLGTVNAGDLPRHDTVIHPVEAPDLGGNDLFVVELIVPIVDSSEPYFTAGNEAFVRVDGAKRKLTGPQLVDWIRRRLLK